MYTPYTSLWGLVLGGSEGQEFHGRRLRGELGLLATSAWLTSYDGESARYVFFKIVYCTSSWPCHSVRLLLDREAVFGPRAVKMSEDQVSNPAFIWKGHVEVGTAHANN